MGKLIVVHFLKLFYKVALDSLKIKRIWVLFISQGNEVIIREYYKDWGKYYELKRNIKRRFKNCNER